jgi:predicted lipase
VLRAENAALREQLKDCSAQFDRQQEQLDRNAEQLAALRKDAERYRWLRDKIENQDLTIAVADSWSLRSWSGDDSDAAIDAAMKEEGK